MGNTVAELRTEEMEVMERIELIQPQEVCQHQEMSLSILLVRRIRQKASMFSQIFQRM
jgi:hypothetical protein